MNRIRVLLLLFGISYSQIDETLNWDEALFNQSDPSTWRPIEGPYKMGNLVTCLEQNDENPYGYKEKFTYGDPTGESAVCQSNPELCARYQDSVYDPDFAGTGDVCDHEDPLVHDENGNRLVRNVCKFSVMFLPAIDDEKSWAWKCARHEICPVKNMSAYYFDKDMAKVYGVGIMGCLVNDKRVMCCCQGDYCQSKPLYAEYARFGNPEYYPIDFQMLANIDPGDEHVEYDLPDDIIIPDWDCVHRGECPMPSTNATTNSTQTIEEIEDEIAEIEDEIAEIEGDGPYEIMNIGDPLVDVVYTSDDGTETVAASVFGAHTLPFDEPDNNMSKNAIGTEDILLVFMFFIIVLLCFGIGICVGTTLSNNKGYGHVINADF